MRKIFSALFLLISLSAFAQVSKTIDLLNDRLIGVFPGNTEPFTNNSQMAQEPSVEKLQTFKIVDADASLVFSASELFAKSTDSMEQVITEHIKSWGVRGIQYDLSAKTTTKDTHFVIYEVNPREISPNNIYKSYFIELPDETVVLLNFYLNEIALTQKEKYNETIKDIIKNLRPGKRKLRASKPNYVIPTTWNDSLVINVSDDLGVFAEKGYAMDVITVTNVVPLLDYASTLVIYTGLQPSSFFPSQGLKPEQQGDRIINISGVEMPFKTFTNGKVYAAEYVYEPKQMVFIHFLIVAYNKEMYEKYIDILEAAKYYTDDNE